jgi:hypothetical protein
VGKKTPKFAYIFKGTLDLPPLIEKNYVITHKVFRPMMRTGWLPEEK